jgi:hypothetical protein
MAVRLAEGLTCLYLNNASLNVGSSNMHAREILEISKKRTTDNKSKSLLLKEYIEATDKLINESVCITALCGLLVERRMETFVKGNHVILSRDRIDIFRSWIWVTGETGCQNHRMAHRIQEVFKPVLELLNDEQMINDGIYDNTIELRMEGANFKFVRKSGLRMIYLKDSFVFSRIEKAMNELGFDVKITDEHYRISLSANLG